MMRTALSLALVAILAGCSSGDVRPPAAAALPAQWASPQAAAGPALTAAWWEGFGSAELATLVRRGEAGNLDLQAAAARVLQAAAAARSSGASLWPVLQGQLSGSNEQRLGGSAPVDGREYFAGLAATYDVDPWGRNRALRQAAQARLRASGYDERDVRLALQSAVANQWLARVALAQRAGIARLNLDNAQRVLATVTSRANAGSATALELAQQRGVVAEQQQGLASLEQQRDESDVRLALLLGVPVQQLQVRSASLDTLAWPQVAAGVPAQLLFRRPDIGRAEAELQAAHADVSAARAALFPSLTLTATLGGDSTRWASLLDNPVYSLGGQLLAPIFDGGSLRAQRDLAQGRELELLASYRSTVLSAVAEVESGLLANAGSDRQVQAQDARLAQAQEAFRLAESRYRVGAETLLVVLDTQRSLYSAQDQWVQLRLARLQASVALFRALGGGWSRS